MRRTLVPAITLLLASATAAAAPPAHSKEDPLCEGAPPLVEAKLRVSGHANRPGVSVEAAHRFGRTARLRSSVSVVDSNGKAAAAPLVNAISPWLPASSSHRDAASLNALPDGYYRARAHVAGATPEEDSVAVADALFRVEGGVIEELGSEEWYAGASPTATITEEPDDVLMECPDCEPCRIRCGEPIITTGVVTGRLTFFNHQGNYCPTGADCTGALYPRSEYDAVLPVRHAKVHLRSTSNGSLLGSGSTDANGYYTIAWGYQVTQQAELVLELGHVDNRFFFANTAGTPWQFSAGAVQLVEWTTETNPQGLGTRQFGTTAADANEHINAFDGAWRAWQALALANRMTMFFSGVRIISFDNQCPTSCARGAANEIVLDTGAPFAPQHRVMHEMGHIASYRSNRDQQRRTGSAYCYNQAAPCSWWLTSAEYSSAAFEEGIATFYGDRALYARNATSPMTCLSSSYCSGLNTETSIGVYCAAEENRQPINVIRYLRDAYDEPIDFPAETLVRNFHEFFDTLHSFDNGTDNRQKDEFWDCSTGTCVMDDPDGRSAYDFRRNWEPWGTDSADAYVANCSPVGD